jgi:hypothetical protein
MDSGNLFVGPAERSDDKKIGLGFGEHDPLATAGGNERPDSERHLASPKTDGY